MYVVLLFSPKMRHNAVAGVFYRTEIVLQMTLENPIFYRLVEVFEVGLMDNFIIEYLKRTVIVFTVL